VTDPSADPSAAAEPTASVAVPVLVLNGPNLGRLGTREPDVYGATTYAELDALCRQAGRELDLDVDVRQTEDEGELLRWLHAAADAGTPVVLNAGAWTHTSVAVADACAMLTAPLIEVHISNVHRREAFRHHSYVSAHATGIIVGLGVEGYVLALSWLSSVATVAKDIAAAEYI
jgi:3-dehydroquinate dehydratase II